MDLVSYVKEHGDPSRTPNGMHAVIPADPSKGLHPGAIFALRNRQSSVNIDQLNRLYPYYLIYIGEDGEVESLFSPGATTALVDSVSGLDDFELIAFLVIQPTA